MPNLRKAIENLNTTISKVGLIYASRRKEFTFFSNVYEIFNKLYYFGVTKMSQQILKEKII